MGLYGDAREQQLLRRERRFLKRSKGDIVTTRIYPYDLNRFLNRGWVLIRDTSSENSARSLIMQIERSVLEKRLTNA